MQSDGYINKGIHACGLLLRGVQPPEALSHGGFRLHFLPFSLGFNFWAGFGTVWMGLSLKCTSLRLLLAGEGVRRLCCTEASLSSSLNPQIKGTWERALFPLPVINLFWTEICDRPKCGHGTNIYICFTDVRHKERDLEIVLDSSIPSHRDHKLREHLLDGAGVGIQPGCMHRAFIIEVPLFLGVTPC